MKCTNPYRNISADAYKKSITTKRAWQYLFIIIAASIGKDYLLPIWESVILEKIIFKIPDGGAFNLATIVFMVFAISKLAPKIGRGMLPTLNSLLLIIVLLFVYIYFGRANGDYSFYTFESWGLNFLVNMDLILIGTFAFVEFRTYNNKLKVKNNFSFIEDSPKPDKNKNNDKLNHGSYVDTLAKHINNTTTSNSFAIGVFANWGSGKTYFLHLLSETLKTNADNVIINFNAWKTNTAESIVEDFFISISKELKKFNPSISSKILDYSKKLFQPGKEIHYRLIDTLINDLSESDPLKSKYDKIDQEIQQTGKRLIIFIDDLDRLSGAEIVFILKIIRNTADFSNTFFVVAIDYDYVVSSIKKTAAFAKEEQYLKKIFQLTVPLPKINSHFFATEVKQYIGYNEMDFMDKDIIDSALKIISSQDDDLKQQNVTNGLLESMLDNLRDVKRFANVIKLNFNQLKFDVVMSDYILLALIQTKHFMTYQLISEHVLFKNQDEARQTFEYDEQAWVNETTAREGKTNDDKILKMALNLLLTENKDKGEEVLIDKNYFWIYFSFQLFNNITFKNFKSSIAGSKEDMATLFIDWNNKFNAELVRILDNFRFPKDLDEIEKFLYTYLRIDEANEHYLTRALELINNAQFWTTGEAKQRSDMLDTILNDKNLPIYNRAKLVFDLSKTSFKRGVYIISEDRTKEILSMLFRQFITAGNTEYSGTTEQFIMMSNDDLKPESNYSMYPETAKFYKEFLETNESAFISFVQNFVRSKYASRPINNTFVFHPMVKDIFGDIRSFITRLENVSLSTLSMEAKEEFQKIKKIILDNCQEVEVKGEFIASQPEYSIIVKHLKKTRQIHQDADEIGSIDIQ
ncbi:P-loop NTPase fold protein [Chitinophaga sp. RCC_12]|uniref:KAP family P-loop NTPase fold protein n=1 Tax=Chitinophaga sp. RCC_12 TaxID=3239226 RepID=UPI0035263F1B